MKIPYRLPYALLPEGTPFTQTKNPLAACRHKTSALPSHDHMVWVWTWGPARIYGGASRIQRGQNIVWQEDVLLLTEAINRDSRWHVTASNGIDKYRVEVSGDCKRFTCECKDEPPEDQLCKHCYGVAIYLIQCDYYTPWEALDEDRQMRRLNLALLLQTENTS